MRSAVLTAVAAVLAAGLQWAAGANPAPRTASVPTVPAPVLPAPPNASVGTPSRFAVDLEAELVVDDLGPVVFVAAPAGDDRLFIVEQTGRILIFADGELLEEPFLDLTDVITSKEVEQGLLGLAFHPGYVENGRFFVYYTNPTGDSRLVEHRVSANDPDRADPRAARLVMAVRQPHHYHNAGMLQFGPDGMLYVAFGDGGGIGDQYGYARRTDSVLGTIVRISVDDAAPYAVPADNPYSGGGGAPEIWMQGLRNPWRFWIDDGLIYIGDVGQGRWEEIDIVPLDSPGADFGWSILEGNECYEADSCDETGLTPPVLTYAHSAGCAVVGGPVYRGEAIPELHGHYFYADFCAGWVRSFRYDGGITQAAHWSQTLGDLGQILSFGTDGFGELYLGTGSGAVYRLVAGG